MVLSFSLIIAVLSATFQNDWAIETGVKVERDIKKCKYQMKLGHISYFAQYPDFGIK